MSTVKALWLQHMFESHLRLGLFGCYHLRIINSDLLSEIVWGSDGCREDLSVGKPGGGLCVCGHPPVPGEDKRLQYVHSVTDNGVNSFRDQLESSIL